MSSPISADARIAALVNASEYPPPRKRAEIKKALQLSFAAKDEQHRQVQRLRSLLILIAATIGLLTAILVTIVAFHPETIPPCFTPPGESKVCPSGNHGTRTQRRSHRRRAETHRRRLGRSLRSAQGQARGHLVRRPVALACVKLATGALTAVAGILLLGAGFVPGLSELDSQRQILAYALVFGYAQQLATHLIDRRAVGIVDASATRQDDAEARR